MRRFTLFLSALLLINFAAKAQTVATFEALTLPGADTAYINYTAPGTDVGFFNGLAYFPCFYDTSSGYGYWGNGFAYSNSTDSVTSGFTNQYSAKTAIGYAGSTKYVVAYGTNNFIRLNNIAAGKPVKGVYVTNNTYAFNSMRDGDSYAKKFGGATGNDPDFFRLLVRGYKTGVLQPDSVEFFLADYRFAHNDSDYIVNTWKWVNLLPLGGVDSLTFSLTSSDNGTFGMNTPAYFCIDNFTTDESVGVANAQTLAAKVYPNPAVNNLFIDLVDDNCQSVSIIDMSGSVIFTQSITSKHIEINTSSLPSGTYLLKLSCTEKNAAMRFVKQ